jgi:hypothetical protein
LLPENQPTLVASDRTSRHARAAYSFVHLMQRKAYAKQTPRNPKQPDDPIRCIDAWRTK